MLGSPVLNQGMLGIHPRDCDGVAALRDGKDGVPVLYPESQRSVGSTGIGCFSCLMMSRSMRFILSRMVVRGRTWARPVILSSAVNTFSLSSPPPEYLACLCCTRCQ